MPHEADELTDEFTGLSFLHFESLPMRVVTLLWLFPAAIGAYLLIDPVGFSGRLRSCGLDVPSLRRARSAAGRLELRMVGAVLVVASGMVIGALLEAVPAAWFRYLGFIAAVMCPPSFCYITISGLKALTDPHGWAEWRWNITKPHLDRVRTHGLFVRMLGVVYIIIGLVGLVATSPVAWDALHHLTMVLV